MDAGAVLLGAVVADVVVVVVVVAAAAGGTATLPKENPAKGVAFGCDCTGAVTFEAVDGAAPKEKPLNGEGAGCPGAGTCAGVVEGP